MREAFHVRRLASRLTGSFSQVEADLEVLPIEDGGEEEVDGCDPDVHVGHYMSLAASDCWCRGGGSCCNT